MSTDGPDVASPAAQARRASRETVIEQPAPRQPMGCPNCFDRESIVLIERVTIERPAFSIDDVGVSQPEVIATHWDDEDSGAAVLDQLPVELLGVRCAECRWSYTGDDPLHRLKIIEFA